MDAEQRGAEAKRVLQEPLLKEAFKSVREMLVGTLEQSALGDGSTHHSIALSLQALGNVKRYLEMAVRDGEFAAAKRLADAEIEALKGKRANW